MRVIEGYTYFIGEDGGMAVGRHQGHWRVFVLEANGDGDFLYHLVATLHDEVKKDRFLRVITDVLEGSEIEGEEEVIGTPDPTIH